MVQSRTPPLGREETQNIVMRSEAAVVGYIENKALCRFSGPKEKNTFLLEMIFETRVFQNMGCLVYAFSFFRNQRQEKMTREADVCSGDEKRTLSHKRWGGEHPPHCGRKPTFLHISCSLDIFYI